MSVKTLSFKVPSTSAEFGAWIKPRLLSYDKWFNLIAITTAGILFVNYFFLDATQSDQRFAMGFGLVLYLWIVFLVFIGRSADKVNRNWWGWMLTAIVFPFIALIAAIIFRTSKTKA